MSAGRGLSKLSCSPVAGWMKPSSLACKACRGNSANAAPAHPADPREGRTAMREQRINQGALLVARSRMDDHSGRLVDDDQVLVLEADVERDRLRHRGRVIRLGERDDDPGP